MLPLDKQNAYRDRYKRQHPGWRPSGEVFEQLTRRYLAHDSRVLDVGCGRGGVMELFWQGVRLVAGLDPDLASLRQHRAGFPRVCALAESLPFPAGSFDLLIAMWVFEHLARPERALAEAHRVLTHGGHLLFLTPNANHPLILFNRFSWAFPAVQRLLVPRLYGRPQADTFPVRYQANTTTQLRSLAAAAAFRVANLNAISDPTYLAFNPSLYRFSVLLEWLMPSRFGIHLVGDFEKA